MTGGATAPGTVGGIDYTERITDGVYNLPGQTEYYGSDSKGTALIGALAGVGALQAIDSGCGPAGKLVRDAAAIADPELDYSDYDTDKDGVVDFFMAVFAGCGGNGSSQLAACTDNPSDIAPYDNVWPHSSSLEFYYSDPETGLPGFTTDDQLKDLEDRPLFYTDESYSEFSYQGDPDVTVDTDLPVYVRVGPYNVNPETAIDAASVISHEYGHSLGLPDFYSTGSRETYGDWNLMATDKSHNIDAFGRQELGWVVPEVLDSSHTETGITDSKQDTDSITWQQEDGTPYTLTQGQDGVGRVQNSKMYVAKLPGRVLLDPGKFETGDTATPVHTWWSRSGNDFGCAKDVGKGHNLDIALPEVADLPEGTTLQLDFKSMWEIEWDYDYGFVLTSTDGGQEFTSNESENGYTTPIGQNPNQNACQGYYGNGITGSSKSYADQTAPADRVLGNYPEMVYKSDSFDISELAGSDLPVLRFSYATDPGLAKRGWFIDDVKITATLPGPDGETRDIWSSDFESSGDPDDPRIFNGGCQADGPGTGACTQGWQYVAAGTEGPSDHAYYLEMRDRSGFDLDGKGQNDRARSRSRPASTTPTRTRRTATATPAPTTRRPSRRWTARRSPVENAPDLDDAAWRPGDTPFTDFGEGHTDNYQDPGSTDGNWHFRYDCLGYDVTEMSGQDVGPETSDGDLTGTVEFTLGDGCGEYDYGYGEEGTTGGDTTRPVATFGLRPDHVFTGTDIHFDASGSSDDETASRNLTYEWDFDNDGQTDDTGRTVTHRFRDAGRPKVALTVTDEAGNSESAGRTFLVRKLIRCRSDKVDKTGSWTIVRDDRANGGSYCRNDARAATQDVLRHHFRGPRVLVIHGDSSRGGSAAVFVDGQQQRSLSFRGDRRRIRFGEKLVFDGFGPGPHTIRVVMDRGEQGFVEGFTQRR